MKSIIVSSFSIPFIMNKFDIDSIDILKVDVEGAEKVLVESNKEWLNKVKIILIELHEGYSVSDLEEDISEYGFSLYEPGSSKGNNILMAARS